MSIPFIDFKEQNRMIQGEVDSGFKKVFEKGDYILGEQAHIFEEAFSKYCEARYGVGVNSGTDALHLALMALGIQEGDEVIVPTHTFIATALCVSFCRAKPVFVDIEPDTCNIDPKSFQAAITKKTKAVIPVHIYGQPANMDEIIAISRKHGIKIVEDAAQAHGSRYKGKRSGSMGDVACFSFYPTKSLGACGDAGMIVTNDKDIYEKALMLRDYGRLGRYEHKIKGTNSRLDTLQAVVLNAKLKHLDTWNEMRAKNAAYYAELLKPLKKVVTPTTKQDRTHVFQTYAVRVPNRDKVVEAMKAQGVGVLIHYPIGLHLQEAFAELGYKKGDFPVAEKVAGDVMSLPMFPHITREQIEMVAAALEKIFVNKPLIICDRLMYGTLLVLIFFLPYSLMMISVCQVMMALTWVYSRILLFKTSSRRDFYRIFNFTPGSMIWPLIAIGLLIALTIPLSHYPSLSFKKLGTRFLYPVLLMFLVIQVLTSRKRLYSVLAVLMFMVFFVSLEALGQYVGGHGDLYHSPLIFGRVSGPMHHPNDLGTLLVTLLPVALVLAVIGCSFVGKRPWIAGVIWALFLVLVCTLGLTSSRGAWIAFAVSMLTLGFCMKQRRVLVSIVLMLIVFFWAFGMYCLSTRIDMYSVSMIHGPVMKPSWTNPWGLPAPYNALQLFSEPSGRDSYWDTAIVVIKQHPWFGCGYNAYIQTLKGMKALQVYPHNSLLHITAELGITGLLFYLWLFVALCLQIKNVLRAVSRERDLFLLGCGISCGILAWMIHSLLDTPWSSLQLSILLWLMIGIVMSLERSKLCR